MVVVIFDPLIKTLKTAETSDNLENLIGVTRIYGATNITHGGASLGNGHWVKGFDRDGMQVCLILNVYILEHVF